MFSYRASERQYYRSNGTAWEKDKIEMISEPHAQKRGRPGGGLNHASHTHPKREPINIYLYNTRIVHNIIILLYLSVSIRVNIIIYI